jgi:DNA polymerase-3 subunit delta'
MEIAFRRTQGLEDAKAFLTRAVVSGKFPHALLVHGPEGMGQNALLLDLVDILLCESPDRKPCGACPGCKGQRDENRHFVFPLVEKSDGGDPRALTSAQIGELADGIAALGGDPYGFAPAEKAVIRIAQVSDLQGKIAYTLAGGRAKVAVMIKVETMDAPVANALLKTLEEPPADTYFLLASEDRSALLPTIVSRCTQQPLFPMAARELRAVVAAKAKAWDLPSMPERLLPFAEGSPGALLALHRNGGDTLIAEAGRFFAAALDPAAAAGNGLAFADYLEETSAFADLASAARLLPLLLRAVRLALRLRIAHPPAPGRPGAWTAQALAAEGLDASLAEALSPLEAVSDLQAFAAWLEELLGAVRDYAKPKNAAFGLYLEYLQKHPAAFPAAA